MRILVALGGNALLRRGDKLTAAKQDEALGMAARVLAEARAAGHQLTITHGNGPQVGLLALQSAAGPVASVMPFDILGAESEGWIGYALERALRNAMPPACEVVTLLTLTRVDRADPAFAHPTKPIGPVYREAEARALAAANDWHIAADGGNWRRVVASPEPQEVLAIGTIRRLVDAGVTVVCAGGGGIPVCAGPDGALAGVEAVIDKDTTGALLAAAIAADLFVMLTDVSAVALDFATPQARRIARASPDALDQLAAAFGSGSMAPKILAACRFARASGGRAAIGALSDLAALITGTAGTTIAVRQSEIIFWPK